MVTVDTLMSRFCISYACLASGDVFTPGHYSSTALRFQCQDDIYNLPMGNLRRATPFTVCSLFTANEQEVMIAAIVSHLL